MPFVNKSPLNYPLNSESSIRIFRANRAPLATDFRNFIVGDEWDDTSSTDFWKLVHKDATSGTWRKMVGTSAASETFIPDTGTSPVVPTAANQITHSGGTGITTVGGLNTMTWNIDADIAQSYVTDAGTATPAANAINILGGTGVGTVGAGANVTINAAGVNQSNIIYVGKHGNDANDGLTINKAFLTFGAAITAALVIAPATVVCLDAGTYVENLTGVAAVDVFAPNATIQGVHTLVGINHWVFQRATVLTGTTGFTMNDVGTTVRLTINIVDVQGTGVGFLSTAGNMLVSLKNATVVNGYLFGALSTDEVNFTFQDVEITGTGGLIGTGAAAQVYGTGNYVRDGGNGTLFFSAAAASTMALVVSGVNVGILSNIPAVTNCRLTAGYMAGALAEVGAGAVDAVAGTTRMDGVPIGAQIPSTGVFTTVTDTSRTQHAVSIYGAGGVLAEVGPLTNGELPIGSTGADPVAATLTAGAGIAITNGAGTITVAAAGGGLTWVEATGAAQAMAVNTAYGANRGAGVTFTLPAAAAAGTVMKIVGILGLWVLAQNAGQSVEVGAFTTTVGAGGSLTATNLGDCITLRCIVADTTWRVESMMGNPAIV